MKPTEKKLQNEPVASPPNQERRKFLRNALLAGAAIAAGCKSENQPAERRETLLKGREILVGSSTLSLDDCTEGESPSAQLSMRRQGGQAPRSSSSLLVPGYFSMDGGGYDYGIYVDSVSCSPASKSAKITIVRKNQAQQDSRDSRNFSFAGDVSLIGAGLAFLAALFLAVFHRDRGAAQDEFALPPKRNH